MIKKGKRLREFEKNNRTFSFVERGERKSKKDSSKDVRRNRNISESTDIDENVAEKKKKKFKIVNMKRFVASVIIVVLIASVGVSAINIIKLTIQRSELQEKNAALLKLKEDLSADMEFINSADYIEQQARKDLKMIKENELLFIVTDDEDKE